MAFSGRKISLLIRDLTIVVISILVAVLMVSTGLIANLIDQFRSFHLVGSFVAGFFWTSIFTVAPATAVLADLAIKGSLVLTALLGAVGGVLADFIIFRFMRDHLLRDVDYLLTKAPYHRLLHIHQLRLRRFLWPLLGAFLLAVPFVPDEVGLTIISLVHVRTRNFIVLSYAFNFLGIVVIGLIARAVV